MVTAAAVCGYFFMREYIVAQEEVSEYTNIQNEHTTMTTLPFQEPESEFNQPEDEEPVEIILPYVEADFEALLMINPDTVGWIAIPDTVISYPVVQATDNTKYLGISFEGGSSKAGTLFADKNNNMRKLDSNTIIYGHNMGAGRDDMFATLLLYKDYDYYMAHQYIQFDTIYEDHGFWKVFAVIYLDTRNTDFAYQQINFPCGYTFMEWVRQAKGLSIHDTGTVVAPSGRVLTLSTCDRSSYGGNGRLIIMAVRVNG